MGDNAIIQEEDQYSEQSDDSSNSHTKKNLTPQKGQVLKNNWYKDTYSNPIKSNSRYSIISNKPTSNSKRSISPYKNSIQLPPIIYSERRASQSPSRVQSESSYSSNIDEKDKSFSTNNKFLLNKFNLQISKQNLSNLFNKPYLARNESAPIQEDSPSLSSSSSRKSITDIYNENLLKLKAQNPHLWNQYELVDEKSSSLYIQSNQLKKRQRTKTQDSCPPTISMSQEKIINQIHLDKIRKQDEMMFKIVDTHLQHTLKDKSKKISKKIQDVQIEAKKMEGIAIRSNERLRYEKSIQQTSELISDIYLKSIKAKIDLLNQVILTNNEAKPSIQQNTTSIPISTSQFTIRTSSMPYQISTTTVKKPDKSTHSPSRASFNHSVVYQSRKLPNFKQNFQPQSLLMTIEHQKHDQVEKVPCNRQKRVTFSIPSDEL